MKSKLAFTTLIAILLMAGCKGPTTESGTVSPPSASTPPSSTSTGGAPPKANVPPPVPDELKTDAYHWYGLENSTPMNVELKIGEGVLTGTQTMIFKQVKPGKAVFDLERGGQLAPDLGTETLVLEKDGIYTVKSTKFAGAVHYLELPTDLSPGKTWKNNGKYKQSDGKVLDQSLDFKVVGVKPVTTPAGTQDALNITCEGKMNTGKERYRMESSFWYVKDRGLVKMEIKMHDLVKKNAPLRVITFQETKG